MFKPYSVVAFNTAVASDNKIHDDDVAKKFGFQGGLVPGVDVYAYQTHPVVERWGMDWLTRGWMNARFVHPVYDGERATVNEELSVIDPRGHVCAMAEAGLPSADSAPGAGPSLDAYGTGVLPSKAERPPASPEAFAAQPVLGAIRSEFKAETAAAHVSSVRESGLAMYEGAEPVAHPGWILRRANEVLSLNVVLGPWMHVESRVQNFGVVRAGDVMETRANVADVFERKGHKFVALDVVMVVDARVVTRVEHVSIYEPRQLR
jgi:acyl dehydratase